MSSSAVTRRADTLKRMATLTDGVRDICPAAKDRMLLCYAAAAEVMARENNGCIDIWELYATFELFVQTTLKADATIKAARQD